MKTSAPKIPLNFFGAPFGLLGLADAWLVAANFGLAPVTLGRVLVAVSVAVWIVVLGAYLRGGGASSFITDLTDAVGGPFGVLIVLTPTLASADALYPLAHTLGTVITDVGIVATVLVAGFLVGDWISGPIDFNKVHPGYFLPSIAGGFVAAASAALVHETRLAQVLFGLGLISWIVIGSIVLGRLFVGPRLATPLLPTLAIEVAPAGVGTFAAFAINGGHVTPLIEAFAGYGLLMIVVQLRLMSTFRKLHFMPSFWSFTFAWAAIAFSGEFWLGVQHPTGWRVESYVTAGLISLLVVAIAARTLLALTRHEYLPAPAATAALTPAPGASERLDRRRPRELMTGPDSYVTKPSPWSAPETARRLEAVIAERGLTRFATIDQQAAAESAGLALRDTELIIFGSPAAGTPVMDAVPLAGLDLPLKLMVWNDEGQTRISYLSTAALAQRYGLGVRLVAPLCGIDGLTDAALLS